MGRKTAGNEQINHTARSEDDVASGGCSALGVLQTDSRKPNTVKIINKSQKN